MKRVMKAAVAAATTAIGITVAVAAPAQAYTVGNPVQLRLTWHGAKCAYVVFPKGQQYICGGGDQYTAEYRGYQGIGRPGSTFGANIIIGGAVESAYCELLDGRTGDIIENDFSRYGYAQCLTNFT